MKVLKIPTIEELKEIDLSYMKTISEESGVVPQSVIDTELLEPPGVVPYPLYAHFSTTFDDAIILDIGTLHGGSALACAYNSSNQVISYDIAEHINYSKIKKDNLTFKVMDFREDNIDYDKVKIIVIDTDHTGAQETEFIQFLIEKDWCGILFLDDIHQNPAMEDFWSCFDDDIKEDVTGIGHTACCGTGLVEFDL